MRNSIQSLIARELRATSGKKNMKEKPMTKHDYQKAIKEVALFSPVTVEPAIKDYEVVVSRETLDCVLHALKLAAIVTGEPSKEMVEAGVANCGDGHPDFVFKAMIAEAKRQAEGGDGQ